MLIIGYYYYAIIATKLKEITHIYKFIYRPDSAAVILASAKGGLHCVSIGNEFRYHRQEILLPSTKNCVAIGKKQC